MTLLEQKSLNVRKKIAIGITFGIGLVLVIVMIWLYSHKEYRNGKDATSKLKDFYATLIQTTQSYFENKSDIISK
jgi:CHASE3 domain sensor protein